MKVVLFEIENHFSPALLEEALELVKISNEYDLSQPEEGFYHCISRQPDYHVEMVVRPDGMVSAKCHCTIYRKNKTCKHAVAAMLLLRDHLLRVRRSRSKAKYEHGMLQEVLQKIKISDLRDFILSYAQSHGVFRAEILAHFLHLIRRPDYQHLLMDITPIDKYGSIRLNRNNLKTVRTIIGTLLHQAHELIQEKALAESLNILDASLHHLYRLIIKAPAFQEQLSTELRQALRLFERLCQQSMAPRLQQQAITLAMDISSREGYSFLKGTKPLLLCAEPFILESKTRQSAFQLAQKKSETDHGNTLLWVSMMMHWMRIWNFSVKQKEMERVIKKNLPAIIMEFSHQEAHEDVLFAFTWFQQKDHEQGVNNTILKTCFRSAIQTGDQVLASTLAYDLALSFRDKDAWHWLFHSNPEHAIRILNKLKEFYPPGAEEHVDDLLLQSWSQTGQNDQLIERLEAIGDIERVITYSEGLFKSHQDRMENLFAKYILGIRAAYGGVVARQKLSNIFSHLKHVDAYAAVMDRLKQMEKKSTEKVERLPSLIKGFVFDLDGVIVDTANHHFQSWKKIMKQLGADIAEEDDLHTRGAGRMESLDYLLERYQIHLSQEEKEMWAARKNELYLASIESITPADLLPGVHEFLKDSREAGLLVALGSASKNAKSVLRKLGISNLFDAILDGHAAKESKPHPEIFTKACEALHLDPSEVVVFEDADKGVAAALAAGCKVVGLGVSGSLPNANMVIGGLNQVTPTQIIERLS